MTEVTEYLDVDAIVPARKIAIRIGGISHAFVEPTARMLLNGYQRQVAISKMDLTDVSPEQVERAMREPLDYIQSYFPTVTQEELMDLTRDQLAAVRRFIDNANSIPEDVRENSGNA